jgi:hypothetical protein
MRTIQAKQITKEEAINHKRNDYNPYEWKRTIESYAKYDECIFFDDTEDVYAIYVPDGVRFCQKVSYSSCLSAGGLSTGCFNDNTLFFVDAGTIAKNKSNFKILREQTKNLPQIFYY